MFCIVHTCIPLIHVAELQQEPLDDGVDTDDSDCSFLYDDGDRDYDGPQSTSAQMASQETELLALLLKALQILMA